MSTCQQPDAREQQQAAPSSSAHTNLGDVDVWQPAGKQGVVWEDWYVKDPEGGWVWGNHREATPEELDAMQAMVREHKHCFAYNMAELAGYRHPVSIGQFRGRPAYARPKQYSPVEQCSARQALLVSGSLV
jgi:hypothetical protein